MIVIEGTVGAGKTTLLNVLKEEGFNIIPEPYLNNPILEKFYEDRKRFAFASQVYFLNKKYELIKQYELDENSVLDRSIYGDYIFAKMLYESGEMLIEEFNIYNDVFENLIKTIQYPTLLINLDISFSEVMKRIKKRGRLYEQKVDVEYWKKLKYYYEDFIKNYQYPLINIKVDNLDIENNKQDRKKVVNDIKTYLLRL